MLSDDLSQCLGILESLLLGLLGFLKFLTVGLFESHLLGVPYLSIVGLPTFLGSLGFRELCFDGLPFLSCASRLLNCVLEIRLLLLICCICLLLLMLQC